MKEKIKKIIATSTAIFSLLLTALSLSSCNGDNTTINTTTTTTTENSKSNSISENKTTTEETEFVFSTVETITTTVATAKPIEEILSEKNIDVELKDYVSPEYNPMIKSVYNLYTLEDIYKLVPFFAENFNLKEDGTVPASLVSAILIRYGNACIKPQNENLEPMVYLDMLYSVKSTYFPNKTIDELKEMGMMSLNQIKEEALYILQNY